MDLQQQTNFERKYYLIKSKKYKKNIIINHLLIWLKRFWYDKGMDTLIFCYQSMVQILFISSG